MFPLEAEPLLLPERKNKKTMTKQQWTQSIAGQWHLFLPPTRPSLSELVVIEKYLVSLLKKKGARARVAILGSTPEYRDLCQSYGAPYWCIDYSEENFIGLAQYMRHKETTDHLLVADWRDMAFEDSFDLFLGDLATTVVPVSDHEKIFKNIKGHLLKGGKALLKTPLRESNDSLSYEHIFRSYRKNLLHLNPFAALWHEVVLADYDFHADTMQCQTSAARLRESLEAGFITSYEFAEFKKRWDVLGDFQMNVPLREAFFKKTENYLKFETITSGIDWYNRKAPILVFRR